MTRYELLKAGRALSESAMKEPSEENPYIGNSNKDMRDLNALAAELFQKEIMEEGVINAINSVVWYNGYYDVLKEVREHIEKSIAEETEKYEHAKYPEFIWERGYKPDHAIGIIWSIMVVMFGEYGSSPRFGWIEKREEAIQFLDMICRNDSEEENDQDECATPFDDPLPIKDAIRSGEK